MRINFIQCTSRNFLSWTDDLFQKVESLCWFHLCIVQMYVASRNMSMVSYLRLIGNIFILLLFLLLVPAAIILMRLPSIFSNALIRTPVLWRMTSSTSSSVFEWRSYYYAHSVLHPLSSPLSSYWFADSPLIPYLHFVLLHLQPIIRYVMIRPYRVVTASLGSPGYFLGFVGGFPIYDFFFLFPVFVGMLH